MFLIGCRLFSQSNSSSDGSRENNETARETPNLGLLDMRILPKVIFRPVECLKLIRSWFPERSADFYSVLNNGTLETWRSIDADGYENVKKTNGLISKTTTLHVHHPFLYMSFLFCTTTTWKCLISRFKEDVNKQRRKFISLSELEYGHFKFSFTGVRLHLTK